MILSPRRRLGIALAIVVAATAGSNREASAFTPALRQPRPASTLPLWATTLPPQEQQMTVEDEQVLFGGGGASPGGEKMSKPEPPNPLDVAKKNPLMNKLLAMRQNLQAAPHLWMELAQLCPNQRAIVDEHLCDNVKIEWTFADMSQRVQTSAAVFSNLGISKNDKVAIFAENSARWLVADHGIQLAGGVSAVRGADAPLEELRYIYSHCDAAGVAVLQGPKLLRKLHQEAQAQGLSAPCGLENDAHGPIKTIVLLNREKQSSEEIQQLAAELDIRVAVLDDLIEAASGPLPSSRRPALGRDDLSTIVYTSGTTGRPKGVMLSHGNLIHQTQHRLGPSQPVEESEPLPGESTVVLLPVWHITERMFELWMLTRGCSICYSSIRTFRNDLAKHQPQWMVLVPRVLEKIAAGVQDKFANGGPAVAALSKLFTWTGTVAKKRARITQGLVVGEEPPTLVQKLTSKLICTALAPLNAVGNKLVWSKVQDGFGGRIKLIISGGSALAGSLEQFYDTAGLKVCVGYGLTECSPLIAFRRSDSNLITAGCAGPACHETELRIVDPDDKSVPRASLPTGEVGVVIAKGPQVMQGYYQNPEATAKAIDAAGFFDTGDLGRINPATGDLILTGRAKDTIVLSNGENIEPTPIEDAILGEGSPLLDQVMLTGQDGRRLLAIVALNPKELANLGYVKDSKQLEAAVEHVNDPKVTSIAECQAEIDLLQTTSAEIRSNKDLQERVSGIVSRATKQFRKWEQVGATHVTLEPFAMANGQLTQSYKVKRDAVLQRYQDELPN